MFSEHAKTFYGLEVVEVEADTDLSDANRAYRISMTHDEAYQKVEQQVVEPPLPPETGFLAAVKQFLGLATPASSAPSTFTTRNWKQVACFTDKLRALAERPDADAIRALVIGNWVDSHENGESEAFVNLLAESRDAFGSLEALFLGDITWEECELSWIAQTNVEPLWAAYPRLREFRVRGASGLSLGALKHENLRSLVIESGGLYPSVIEELGNAELPALEHLELWLGEENYGWKGPVESLRPLLSGEKFPNLRYLGLRNSAESDAIAKLVAESPLPEGLEVLDLSLGTLGDEGAEALAASEKIRRLKKLDVHHHYLTDAGIEKLKAPGIEVDVSEPKDPDEYNGESWRYIFVGE